MHKQNQTHRFLSILVSFFLVGITLIVCLTFSQKALAGEQYQETEHYCLSCHGNPDLSMTLPNGEVISLYLSHEILERSLHHQEGIECEACHTEIKTYPHPEMTYDSSRELSRGFYLSCRKCHAVNYEKTLDSMHAQVADEGNLDAPICTDCHGSHDIQLPDQPRSLISDTCGVCHQDVYEQYHTSIHAGALIEEDNPDVPVCTDCHGVHNIHDPRTAQFRVETPDLCAGCHADSELMSKYGLTSDVYSLYETSWHGVDVSVYKANWPTIWHDSAVCTDCHGVHNIFTTENPESMVHPDNLLQTCQKCHPDAGPNWTGSWTGHNKIDRDRTPILFYVDQFYASFTPVVLLLSIAYVFLRIIHNLIERIRRSMP